jgi:hypothetical protein
MTRAERFNKSFSPYHEKYICQHLAADTRGNLVFSGWMTIEQPLTDGKIERAIGGRALFGFFLSYCASCFALDIDDHTGKGDGYLLSVYERVVRAFHAYPSMTRRSPRGLHCFYFLTHPVPEALLIARVKELTRQIPVEVKPTATVGLRIPAEHDLLDPETLRKLSGDFRDLVEAALMYHPIELFYEGLEPRSIIENLKKRQGKLIATGEWKTLARIQAQYADIESGGTNAALCELIPVYRSAGLSATEAAAEFAALLAPRYAGELTDTRRLLQRVTSFYRHEPETRFNAIPKTAQVELFTSQLADALAALVTGPTATVQQRGALTKKRGTVRRAVVRIEQWRIYLDEVKASQRFMATWDYLYPFFKKNTGEGYYPLSRNILKKLHSRYHEYLLPFLEQVGYLQRSPYQYSSVYGICYYYRILGDQFIERMPSRQPVVMSGPMSKAELRAEQIRAYKREHMEMSNRAIAQAIGYSLDTVNRVLGVASRPIA